MADETWPSVSSSIEATIGALDSLDQQDRQRRTDLMRQWKEIAAPEPFVDEDDEPVARQGARPVALRRQTGDRPPFVPMPRRTTHGGPFGPAVREKLTREALERSGW